MPTFTAPDGSPVSLTPEQQAQALQLAQPAVPTFTKPDGTPVDLSPDQQAQAMQLAAQPPRFTKPDGTPLDPVQDLDAPQLAALNEQAPDTFSLTGAYNALPPESRTPETVQKLSEAHDLVSNRKIYQDLPSVGTVLSNLWGMAKGAGQLISNTAKGATLVAGGYPGHGTWMDPEKVKEVQRGVAEGWSGTESAVTGLATQIANVLGKGKTHPSPQAFVPGFGSTTPQAVLGEAPEVTAAKAPHRKIDNFLSAAAQAEQQAKILSGKGEFMQSVGGSTLDDLAKAGYPVRPEEASKLAAADPFSWYVFGKAFDAMGPAAKAAIPTAVANSISAVGDKAANIIKQTVGGAADLASKGVNLGAAAVEKSAKPLGILGSIGTAIHTGSFHPLIGLMGERGGFAASTLEKVGKALATGGENLKTFGEGVSGPEATGPISQAAKDVIEAAPGAVGAAAKGAALDVGLQAATAETPEQKAGFTPVGTALGLTHGALNAGKWIVGGQLAGERNWGATAGVPNSGAFPELNQLHNAAMSDATPKIQERIRAIQQLKQGVNPNTDVFYVPNGEQLTEALQNTPSAEAHAFQAGDSNGVFLKDLTGADGKKRNAIIFQSVSAAPHEAVHAMDAALGSERVNELNQAAKQQYGGVWDQFTQRYAELLNGGRPLPEGATPGEFLLDRSGFGAEAARNKNGGTGEDWQTALTPEEKQGAVDRYIGAEIRAENGDAYFKRTGGKQPAFTDRMGNAAGELVSLLGGNPLEGRTSSGLNLPLDWQTFKQAGKSFVEAKEQTPPAARPIARKPLSMANVPTTPEAISQAADDARTIASQSEAVPGAAGEQSPKEALGTVAEAIASQAPVRYQYRGAKGETPTGGALETDVAQRQEEIEKARNVPEDVRNLFERVGFPYKVEMSGKGPQVLDWAPVNLAANAFRWARSIAELARRNPNAPELAKVPYPMDVAKSEFTPEGWRDLFSDAQKYTANQLSGFGGGGQEIVVPSELGAANVHAPARSTATAPEALSQDRSDFLNMLYGERPPETPRVSRKSGVPLNVVAQKVSAATEAGRIVEPSQIRAKPKQAAALGIEPGSLIERAPFKEPILGVEKIQEVNPTRGALENALQDAGIEVPKLTKVIRRLNLEHIHSVQPEPNLPRTAGANVLTTTAGFQPKVGEFIDSLDRTSPEEWAKMSHTYQGKFGGGQTGLSWDVGAGAQSLDEVNQLRSAQERYGEMMRAALKNKDYNTASTLGSKAQAAREAYEAATDTGGTSEFIRRYHPEAGFKAPFPETEPSTIQAVPRNEDVAKVADDYARTTGLAIHPLAPASLTPELGKQLADFADEALHAPANPDVKASYAALNSQIKQQFDAIQNAGYKLEPWTGAGEPYKSSADMTDDVRNNKHLFFLPTQGNFSGPESNLMLQPSGVDGFSNNDLFRAVHDFFGHAKEGHQFGPKGEFNAWREHAQMFTPEAQGALAAETLGQNAWVNFGKHLRNEAGNIAQRGEPNFIPPAARPFAEQKNFLIPAELRNKAHTPPVTHVSEEDLNSAPGLSKSETERLQKQPGPFPLGETAAQFKPKEDKEIELRHWSNVPGLKVLDPEFHGTGLSGDERIRARDYKKIYLSRTYFGTKDYTKEPNLGPEEYRALVKRDRLYPFQEDPKDLWPSPQELESAGYAPMDARAANTLYENKIAKAGYEGYIHRDAKVAAKFTKTPVKYIGGQFLPSTEPRAIRAAAVQDKDTGKIFEGPMHFYAHKAMVDAGYDPHDLFNHPQGFVTNEGEFLNRIEAAKRAVEMSQIKPMARRPGIVGLAAEEAQIAGPTPAEQQAGDRYIKQILARPAQFKPAGSPKLQDFQAEDKLGKALTRPGWTILTATEEKKGPGTAEVNELANQKLADQLTELGYDFLPVEGSYKGVPQGMNFLVTGISPQDALALGKQHNQESVLVPQGLLYQDGSVHPVDSDKTVIGPDAAKKDFYSKIAGGPDFSMGIDFDKKIAPEQAPVPVARPEQQMMGGEFSPTKELAGPNMSPAEAKERYPEAVVVPDKENGKPVGIGSDVTSSPLYKEAGGEKEAVDVFSKRLADFARQYKDNPAYKDGLRWYSEFVPMLKTHFGKNAQIMAELLAATSPQNNPTQNFAMANDALEMWKRGKFDKQLSKFEEGVKKIEDGSWKNSGAPTEAKFMADWIEAHDLKPRQSNGKLYNMHSVPVLQVLARRWLENTGGPKTQNFVKNLLGTGHGATYDVWADRTLRRIGYSGHQARWRILPKNAIGVSDADFHFGQKIFSKAAKELGVRADSLQGALWFAEKQLWADNGWGRLDLGDFRKEIKNRELLNRGIEQRLSATEAKATAPKAEQRGFDL